MRYKINGNQLVFGGQNIGNASAAEMELVEEGERLERKLAESEAGTARLRAALEDLKDWMSEDSVAGSGDYEQGLMCGIEDRGYQADGYSGMRYGYDRALERVSERIDGVIESALATNAGKSALAAVRLAAEGLQSANDFGVVFAIKGTMTNEEWSEHQHDTHTALSRLRETFGTGGSES